MSNFCNILLNPSFYHQTISTIFKYFSNFYKIKNWSKYQSADKLEEIRLQNCLRQQKYREKMKSEKEKSNVTVTQRNTKEEKKIRNKIEKEGDENRSGFKEFKL